MKMKNLSAALMAFSLGACAVKSDEQPKEDVNVFAHSVKGPTFDGTWASGCVETYDSSKKIAMTFKGQDVTRTTQYFSDRDCLALKETRSYSGQFRYKAVVRNEGTATVYEVEYRFALGGGVSQITGENIKPTSAALYISDFRLGDYSTDIPLVKSAPAPQPNDPLKPIPDHSPSVGQSVRFEGVLNGEAQVESYQIRDFNGTQYSVHSEVTVSTTSGSMTTSQDSSYRSLASTAEWRAKMANCEVRGGRKETVTTKAGRFETCAMTENGTTRWYANVPLWGIVKVQAADGHYRAELVSFTLAR